MINILSLIKEYFKISFTEAFQNYKIDDIEITVATQAKFGDYQCNSAMKLSKVMQKNPREIAQQLIDVMQNSPLKLDGLNIISKLEIAGPGFINIYLSDSFIEKKIEKAYETDKLFQNRLDHRKVVVDFSSPNIAKEMHVGHLRSTIIGDCIARVLEMSGYDVLRLNHLGDWGTQFGMLIAYIKLNKFDAQTLTLSQLMELYKKSKELFDLDEDFKKTAQKEVVSLQSGNIESKQIWETICDVSKKAYKAIYDVLDVKIEDRGESYYNHMLPSIVENFKSKGLLKESNGAQCIFIDGFFNRDGDNLPLIIQKSDGGFNYATTDLAALKHRIQDEKSDWIIYVTDSGQSQHFSMVFEAGKQGKIVTEEVRLDHVPFGLVLRNDGKKFKTRSGDTEKLIDLIDTAIARSKEIMINRHPDESPETIDTMARALGINAIKYADLSNNRTSDYVFSYEKMLSFEGNTAAFLMYALVRIKSIISQAQLDNNLSANEFKITHPQEKVLALQILRFPEVIDSFIRDLQPNLITEYLFVLASEFHKFFHECRVIGSEQIKSRIILISLVEKVILKGFECLGLIPVTKM